MKLSRRETLVGIVGTIITRFPEIAPLTTAPMTYAKELETFEEGEWVVTNFDEDRRVLFVRWVTTM